MLYYVTQYIETRGILTVDSEDEHFEYVEVTRSNDLRFHGKFDFNRTSHFWIVNKENWFTDYSAALADAEEKKRNRIAKVTEQLERLKALSFPPFPANAGNPFLNPAPDAECGDHTLP